MLTILAHSGHDHGADPSWIALLAVAAVLAALGLLAAIRAQRRRASRSEPVERVPHSARPPVG
jgi:hypothetical protein